MKGRGLFGGLEAREGEGRGGGEGRCSELLCAGAPRSPLASRRVGRGHRGGAAPLPANEGTGPGTAAERGRRLCRARGTQMMVLPPPFPRQRQPSGFLQGGACPRLGRARRRKRGSVVLKQADLYPLP